MNAGLLNGEFESITSWDVINQNGPTSISGYLNSKFNNVKQCLTSDSTSYGCKPVASWGPYGSTSPHNARWIFPNGTRVQVFDNQSAWGFNPQFMIWVITAKPAATVTVPAKDTIWFMCNLTTTPTLSTGWGTLTIRPLSCGSPAEWADHLAAMN